MLKKSKMAEVVPGAVEGARSATGSAPGAAAEVKRWSANRKKQVVLRLLRGEPVDAISREVSVPIYRLEEWRERALAGIDAGLKERENDPLEAKLGEATRRIGELVMENELLRKERQARHPLVKRRAAKRAERSPLASASPTGWSESVARSDSRVRRSMPLVRASRAT